VYQHTVVLVDHTNQSSFSFDLVDANLHNTSVRLLEASHGPKKLCLPYPRRAEKANHLALLHAGPDDIPDFNIHTTQDEPAFLSFTERKRNIADAEQNFIFGV
jgi:hypothetical protein